MASPSLPPPVGRARRSFFERGTAPLGGVPETILQSWCRCRQQGLAADAPPALEPVAGGRLHELRQHHERLWRLARAELDGLSGELAATDSMVLLTDAAGWILDAEGSPGFLDRAGRVALMPGVCWDEATVGTNAIGTAIVEGRSVQVRGGEHYRAPHGILSCSATPIFDPCGTLVGVLDISGDSRVQHLHAPGMARQAVARIEHRYFEQGIEGAELVRLHHDPALLGTVREGLLAFRGGRLVAANRVGLKLFGLERHDLGRATYESLFEVPLSRLHDDGALIDRQGRSLYGHLQERRQRAFAPSSRPLPFASATAKATTTTATTTTSGPVFGPGLEQALEQARRVLDAGLPVLVQGETGTGKEVFARELHRRCTRAGKPFVAVNCAALPEGLIEAELFGYEEGAFTGARKQGSPGLLRQAQGGVLFLDEIGDMPLALQPRLLRVLQDRELSPLGGGKPVKLDFALVCATHCDLDDAIAAGRFRPDLYYRIADHQVRIAAVREHDDRAGLVRALWSRLGGGRRLSAAALQALVDYGWPGNLRQLSSCLRTLVALSDDGALLDVERLPGYLRRPSAPSTPPPAVAVAAPGGGLEAMTAAAMRQALAECGGNVARAARRLGISRSTLYRRLGPGLRGS
ncbi:sigma-54-dependent Fis family transcriptional regulator [Stenotrophomonas sp. Marseille-Q4652]|uniref:sigma-54-dependent Fis family transcriptional regulator n=1 Tax=Stenotrophomonas sp. Marseille-Q4652 TaxID=2866595 RepID=UPI001CE46A31|nr:sigma-54-dependent Fis family transcriptional regulator [Stenotrophomonas sp. Marseille-Q4652]